MLPGGQLGPDVAAEARHLNPHMAIVYMTGYADVGAASALGNVDGRLLRKPFTRAKLAEELSAALAMKGRPV